MSASRCAQALVFAAAFVSPAGALEAACPSTGLPSHGTSLFQYNKIISTSTVDEESGGDSIDVLDCKFEHSGPQLLEAKKFKYGDCVTENGTTYYMFAGEAVNKIMPGEITDLELKEDQDIKLDDGSKIYRVERAFSHEPGPNHTTSKDIQQLPNTSAFENVSVVP